MNKFSNMITYSTIPKHDFETLKYLLRKHQEKLEKLQKKLEVRQEKIDRLKVSIEHYENGKGRIV